MIGRIKPKEAYVFDCLTYNSFIDLLCKSKYNITNQKDIHDVSKWVLAFTLREVFLVNFVGDDLTKATNSSLINIPRHYPKIFYDNRIFIEREIMLRAYTDKFMRFREHELKLDIHGHAGILYY